MGVTLHQLDERMGEIPTDDFLKALTSMARVVHPDRTGDSNKIAAQWYKKWNLHPDEVQQLRADFELIMVGNMGS